MSMIRGIVVVAALMACTAPSVRANDIDAGAISQAQVERDYQQWQATLGRTTGRTSPENGREAYGLSVVMKAHQRH